MAVLNKYKLLPGQTGIYIGRGSMWGNKFVIGVDGTRDEVCDKHEQHLWKQIQDGVISLEQLAALEGHNLICFCAPCRCHGHTLERASAWAIKQLALKPRRNPNDLRIRL